MNYQISKIDNSPNTVTILYTYYYCQIPIKYMYYVQPSERTEIIRGSENIVDAGLKFISNALD
jgi:hypothetical protein